MGEISQHATVIRAVLAYLAIQVGVVAAYILIAPRSFYDEFPPALGPWVSTLPPYNEHLIRDYGSAGLGLAAVALLAAIWMERRVVQAACVAIFLGTLPHAIYHSTTTEALSTGDNLLNLSALYGQALLPLLVLYLASGSRQAPGEPAPPRWRPRAIRKET